MSNHAACTVLTKQAPFPLEPTALRVCLFLPITFLGVFLLDKISYDHFTSLWAHERKTDKPSSIWKNLSAKPRLFTGLFQMIGCSCYTSAYPKVELCLSDTCLINHSAIFCWTGSRSHGYFKGLLSMTGFYHGVKSSS